METDDNVTLKLKQTGDARIHCVLPCFIVCMTHSAMCVSKKIARSQTQPFDGRVRTVMTEPN